MRSKDTDFPSHIRGVEDFPPDYREHLRQGPEEDRREVNREIMETLPVHSIGAFLELLAETYGDKVAIREPPGEGVLDTRVMTYHRLLEYVQNQASVLISRGVQHGDRVGIVSENNLDALILKLACQYIGAIALPWTERIEDAGMTTNEAMERAHVPWLALHQERSIRHILEADENEFPHIHALRSLRQVFGVTNDDEKRIAETIGSSPLQGAEPALLKDRMANVQSSDTAMIFYSPGTGGLSSKMVEISHANLFYQYCVTPGVLRVPPGARYLHVLPPYHIFGDIMLGMVLSMGGEVTLTDLRRFVKGDRTLLFREQFQLFAAIPDFWRYLRMSIEKALPAFVRSTIQEDMVKVAWADIVHARATGDPSLMEATGQYWKSFSEEYGKRLPKGTVLSFITAGVRAAMAHLLYPVIRKRAGIGSLQWGISGGAKLSPEDYAFFSALKGTPQNPGIQLHSGYGLTEAGVCGISSFDATFRSRSNMPFAATVGDVIPGTVAWTEQTAEGCQEICITGPGIARYRDVDLQQELIPDGVLHTGDQGQVIEIKDQVSGAIRQLVIHGRQLKRMIKWKGASMLPAPMEVLLQESPFITDALVVGDGHDRIGVLVFPNSMAVAEYCCTHRIEGFDPDHPNWDHPSIRALFQKEIESRMRITVTKQRARIDSFRVMGELPQELRMASRILHPLKTEEYFAGEIAALWRRAEFAIKK